MTTDAQIRPGFVRFAFAVGATALSAPLLSPPFLFWVFVAVEGAMNLAEFASGILSGAMFALRVGLAPALAVAAVLGLVVWFRFESLSARSWWVWCLLGAVGAPVMIVALVLLAGTPELVLPAIPVTAIPGFLGGAIFRSLLLGGHASLTKVQSVHKGS